MNDEGRIEGIHNEVRTIFGSLVRDVMRRSPDGVSQLLPCVERVIYNPRGPRGRVPRDLDRSSSTRAPLERGLHGAQVSEFEPVDE